MLEFLVSGYYLSIIYQKMQITKISYKHIVSVSTYKQSAGGVKYELTR